MNALNVPLLTRQLRSPEPLARAAATRVFCYWRDRVPAALDLLKTQAKDENALVRLEALRAATKSKTATPAPMAPTHQHGAPVPRQ